MSKCQRHPCASARAGRARGAGSAAAEARVCVRGPAPAETQCRAGDGNWHLNVIPRVCAFQSELKLRAVTLPKCKYAAIQMSVEFDCEEVSVIFLSHAVCHPQIKKQNKKSHIYFPGITAVTQRAKSGWNEALCCAGLRTNGTCVGYTLIWVIEEPRR